MDGLLGLSQTSSLLKRRGRLRVLTLAAGQDRHAITQREFVRTPWALL
jgi:hypothetical protein